VRLEGLGQLKNIHLIGTRTRDLPACSIVPQPTKLPCMGNAMTFLKAGCVNCIMTLNIKYIGHARVGFMDIIIIKLCNSI
jgi:hypothetical protein